MLEKEDRCQRVMKHKAARLVSSPQAWGLGIDISMKEETTPRNVHAISYRMVSRSECGLA